MLTRADLIAASPMDPRVRDLAQQVLPRDQWSIGVIAQVYRNDEEMRRRVVRYANPLPATLRSLIAERLGKVPESDAESFSRLDLWDAETDGAVKAQASLSYHSRLSDFGGDTDVAVTALLEILETRGVDANWRVPAAVCGLFVLGKTEELRNLHPDTSERVRFTAFGSPFGVGRNPPLTSTLLRHWQECKAVFADTFWVDHPLAGHEGIEFWRAVSSIADEYPEVRIDLNAFLETCAEPISAELLRYLERTQPRGRLTRDHCMRTLRIGERGDCTPHVGAVVAATILGTHFNGDADLSAAVVNEIREDTIQEKVILMLSEGWPDSDALRQQFDRIRHLRWQLSYASIARLYGLFADGPRIVDFIVDLVSECERSEQLRYDVSDTAVVFTPLMRRAQRDASLRGLLKKRLPLATSASERITIARLLSASAGVDAGIHAWINDQIERQTEGNHLPEMGFDMIAGAVRPLVHSLLDVLAPTYAWGRVG